MAYDRARVLAREIDPDSSQVLELYLGRGRVMELRGAYKDALANYEELEQLAQHRGDAALELQALIQHAKIHSTPNTLLDLGHAEKLALHALDVAREIGERVAEAKVLWNLLLVKYFAGQHEDAIRYGEASRAIARELNLREQLAYTLNDLARPYMVVGRLDDFSAAQAEAESLWRELNNLPMLTDNLMNSATYLFLSGNTETSLVLIHQALKTNREIGNVWGESFADGSLGGVYLEWGDLGAALEHLQDSVHLGAQVNYVDPIYTGHLFLGLLYHETGEIARGIVLLEEALTTHDATNRHAVGPLAALAYLYTAHGELARAQTTLEQAQSLYDGNIDSPIPIVMGIANVALRLAQGQPAEAITLAQELVALMDAYRVHPYRALIQLLHAMALEQLGMTRDAIETLEETRGLAEKTHSYTALWQILAMLARLYEGEGETELAHTRKRDGRSIAQYVADHAPEEFRTSFLNRSDAQALFEN